MADTLDKLGSWVQTRNTLVTNLGINIRKRDETPSNSSEHHQLQRNVAQLIDDLHEHAKNGLKIINRAIATSAVLDGLKEASQEAKNETDRIKRATAAVAEMTGVVDKLSKLVTSFGQIVL